MGKKSKSKAAYLTLEDVASRLSNGEFKNVVFMVCGLG
jgi:hypothetical protein